MSELPDERAAIRAKPATARSEVSDRIGGLMARPDRSKKMAYAFIGIVFGAIIGRVVFVLRDRIAYRRQVGVRMDELTL